MTEVQTFADATLKNGQERLGPPFQLAVTSFPQMVRHLFCPGLTYVYDDKALFRSEKGIK
ncbi:hypothetical protein ACTXT7_004002 [Hymenolepis weldensis]